MWLLINSQCNVKEDVNKGGGLEEGKQEGF